MNKEKNRNNRFLGLINPYLSLPKEVYIIFISRIINSMGALVWPVMTFILEGKLGFSDKSAGLILIGAGVILAFPPLIGGKLADSIGKKRTIVIFDILGLTFFYICAIIPVNRSLVIFLFLASLFSSIAGPAHDALLGDLSTPKNRKQVYALSYMGWNLGFAFGGAISGFLFKNYLWLIFIGDATTTLISLTLIMVYIKNIYEKNKDSNNELEKEEPGSIIHVLIKRPKLIIFAVIIMGLNFVYSQWGFLIQSNLRYIYGDNGAKFYGLIGTLNAITVILFTAILSSYLVKTRHYKIIIAGGITYMIGFGLLGVYHQLFPYINKDYIFFFIGVCIITIGEILLAISVSPYIFNHTPSNHRGRMSATLGLIMGLGWLLGPVTGVLVEPLGYEIIWRIISLLALICTISMLMLGKIDKSKKT